MSKPVQKRTALALAAIAGTAVLVFAIWLSADELAAQRRQPTDKALVAALTTQVQKNAARAAVLQSELDRQRDDALHRAARQTRLARILTLAAVIFLVSAKWLVSLHAQQRTARRKLVELTTTPPPPQSAHALPVAAATPAAITDLAFVDETVAREGRSADALIPILQALQAHYRYLPEPALRRVCETTEITPAQLAGVATFYNQFRRTPVGEHVAKVCHGTACHVAGAPRITEELRRRLNIAPGQDTDPTRRFTVEPVACLGCCTLAPVVQIDGAAHGHVRADTALDVLLSAVAQTPPPTPSLEGRGLSSADNVNEIRLGLGSCCVANGSGRVHTALLDALAEFGASVNVKRVGCVGMCHQTPFIEVRSDGRTLAHYGRVQPLQVRSIVHRHFKPPRLSRRMHRGIADLVQRVSRGNGHPTEPPQRVDLAARPVAAFLDPQQHIATEHYGHLDPTDLDEYIRHDGLRAWQRCGTDLAPDEIIDQIRRSGLRGRGGAGFPTAAKWSAVRAAPGQPKYIICNGDEGDPGAFMDRMLMESYPYRVIEGVAIAAFAVGATEGIFYIRREYPLAIERMRDALRQCEQRGLLRPASDAREPTRLHLRIVEGAGAFVCGEETALIASLAGQRGMPSLRPPYPAQSGLHGRPTLVNNVETCAVVPWIIRHGPDAFAALGTPTSPGTKVFALTGKIRRGGLIEVPMGITIRRIVEDIGGGIQHDRRFKAVQIGGPSGGCIPAKLADTPVDYEALASVGAMMGSGGLVVLDERDCMVDLARYFLSFTQDQSCGKCTPCRVGTRRLLDILERLCDGHGQPDDLAKLEHLAHMVAQSSLCGLGKTAPNPVLTTLRYFRNEYEAHLQGRCPAGRCKALIKYEVTDACTGCTLCAQHCPVEAIAPRPYEKHEIDAEKCTRCDVCRATCPEDAIEVV